MTFQQPIPDPVRPINYRESQGTDARTSLIDAAGNTRQYTDRDGRVTTFEYDDLYRPTREVWKNSNDQEIREFVYDYDAVGNLLSVADNTIDPSSGARTPASDSIQLVYDDLDQVQLERTVNPLVGTSTILDHDYNLGGRPTQTAVNLGGVIQGTSISGGIGDLVNQYAWDDLGRMTSVTQTAQSGGNAVADKLATFQYDTASELTDLRRYSATSANSNNLEVHSRWTYDQAGRLQSITHAKSEIAGTEHWDGTSTLPTSLQGGALLAGYYLQYDQANRLTGWSSYYDAFKTTYSYDTRDQLTGATHAAIAGLTPPAALPAAESYSFDTTGNRLLAGGTSSSASGTYNEVQNDGTYTYDYDAEGNQIRRTHSGTGAVTEYEYDYRNRLVKVTERASVGGAATQIVEYQYDAFDRRTGKELDSDADGVVDRREAWAWDADQVLLQLVDADGDGSGSWKLADRYLYGAVLDMVLADEQLPGGGIALNSVSSTAGTVLWPLGDQLGSVRNLVDSNGVIREHVVYDSFGRQQSETDFDSAGTAIASSSPLAVDTLFGFTGREWDADTELQYNRARWYDPAQGRWLGQDPLGFGAGDVNLYRYVDNGPTGATDPSGMWNPFRVKQDPTRKRRPGLVTGADILNDMHRRNAAMRPIVEQYDHAIQKGKAIGQAGQRMFAEAAFGPVVPAAEAIGGKDVFKTECNQLTPKQRAKSAAWAAFYVLQIFADDFIEAGRLAFFRSADEAAELSHSGAASRLLAAEQRDVAQNAAREGLELAEDAAQVARTSKRLDNAARVCKNAPKSTVKNFDVVDYRPSNPPFERSPRSIGCVGEAQHRRLCKPGNPNAHRRTHEDAA